MTEMQAVVVLICLGWICASHFRILKEMMEIEKKLDEMLETMKRK